jgi:hypothetical protein
MTSSACRDDKRVPFSVVGALCGVSRLALYIGCCGPALEDHPDYAQFKDALEGIHKKDFSHIWRDPPAEWHRTTNPAVAYWSEGQLYCEAGSEIWAKLSELGRFSGADRESPQPIDIVDIADTVVSFSIAEENNELAAWWYAALAVTIFWEISSRHLDLAPDDQTSQRIRDVVAKSEAYKIKQDQDGLWMPPLSRARRRCDERIWAR